MKHPRIAPVLVVLAACGALVLPPWPVSAVYVPAAKAVAAPGYAPAPLFLSAARIVEIRARVARGAEPTARAFARLRQDADAALDRVPQVPERWHVPSYYRDGPGHTAAKAGLMNDANAAYALGLAYALTDDERYAAAAVRIITAWAALPDAGQGRRFAAGVLLPFSGDDLCGRHGAPQRRVDAGGRAGVRRVPAREGAADEHDDDAQQLGQLGRAARRRERRVFAGRAPFQPGGGALEGVARRTGGRAGRAAVRGVAQPGPGDSGLWYSHFSLMPATITAEVARQRGLDLYGYRSPAGRTLRQAFERLAPWAHDPNTFPYDIGRDRSRGNQPGYVSYFELLNSRWPNPDATAMLDARRPMSADHSTPYLTLTHGGIDPGL